jgi:hypothetical protein
MAEFIVAATASGPYEVIETTNNYAMSENGVDKSSCDLYS